MNYFDAKQTNRIGGRIVLKRAAVGMIALLIGACSSRAPMETVEYVDLERFMGDWYVIANIPTSIEKEAYNAVESYQMNPDGTIATTFTFRKGGFDGEKKRYEPKGFVRDTESNAEWGMQFIWPIKADYRIIYLDEDYQLTVIGRTKRDYVWVMARDWSIPEDRYREMQSLVESVGYDISELRKVPQRW